MWSCVTNIRNIEALFGLSCFHHSLLTFRGTHTSCSCLVWFPFLIFITHNSKNWVRFMEWEQVFGVFEFSKLSYKGNFAILLIYLGPTCMYCQHQSQSSTCTPTAQSLCTHQTYVVPSLFLSFTFLNSFLLVRSFISSKKLKRYLSFLHP